MYSKITYGLLTYKKFNFFQKKNICCVSSNTDPVHQCLRHSKSMLSFMNYIHRVSSLRLIVILIDMITIDLTIETPILDERNEGNTRINFEPESISKRLRRFEESRRETSQVKRQEMPKEMLA